ncbi:MAG TPA: hypothetical protein VKA37_00440 [Halobacteriales archaeon]|nr:hypothetical protein [Halobacteriales archaeon]
MRRAARLGALALLVVLAGCTGFLGEEPVRDEQAVAAAEESKRALSEVESYRFTTDLHVEATDGGRTEQIDATSLGAVNATAKRLNVTARIDDRTQRSYLLNRTNYKECPMPGAFWAVENQTADEWVELTPAFKQLSLLESGDLRTEGAATVDGRAATHVVGEPSGEAFMQYIDERNRPLIGGPEIRDPQVEVWIDNETRLPLKTRLRFTVAAEGGTATARQVTRYRAYGEPVSVELPAEAREGHVLEGGCVG